MNNTKKESFDETIRYLVRSFLATRADDQPKLSRHDAFNALVELLDVEFDYQVAQERYRLKMDELEPIIEGTPLTAEDGYGVPW